MADEELSKQEFVQPERQRCALTIFESVEGIESGQFECLIQLSLVVATLKSRQEAIEFVSRAACIRDILHDDDKTNAGRLISLGDASSELRLGLRQQSIEGIERPISDSTTSSRADRRI